MRSRLNSCHHSSLGEEKPEEIRVWLHPEESLTDGDETSNVQHPRWIEMLQLQTPLIEEPTQELVHRVP